ncbi:MAG: ribose-5-phosphate isomerase RpiA [Acidobacteria bacterium]|nr:ribose-5-phosphate isomerase RpiA [Acidobacteriota bacterium]
MSDDLKRQAALAALDEIRSGMIVGLGSGSTAAHFIRELGSKVRGGLKVAGIPTSEESRRLAGQVGVPLTSFEESPLIDVTVDGADEVSPALDLIKGLGGALVREKIVAQASKRVVIIVDESKLVERLGSKSVIPVEVIPLAVPGVVLRLREIGGEARIREKDGRPFVSDNGNTILDWKHAVIEPPADLEKQLKLMTGVVDSGIFAGVAQCVIVAGEKGIRKIPV